MKVSLCGSIVQDKNDPAFLSLFHYLQSHIWKNTEKQIKKNCFWLVFLSILHFYSFVLLFNLIPNYYTVLGTQGLDVWET